MISFLLFSSSFLNFAFYIYAIGFVVALVLEQFVKNSDNERNIYGLHVMWDYISYQETCNPQDMIHFGMVLSKFFPKVSKQ